MDEEQWINRNSLIERGRRARGDRPLKGLIDLLHSEIETEDTETESQKSREDERGEEDEPTAPPTESPDP